MRKYLYLLLFLGLSFTTFSQTSDSISAKETLNHYNETVKVYGTVSGGRWLQTSFLTLINVDGNYPNHALTIIVKGINHKKFTYKLRLYSLHFVID